MSWVLTATAVGAGASYLNNQAKKKNEQASMLANAEAMRYSPWTHMETKMMGKTTGSDIAAIGMGGLQGAQFGSQFGKGTPDASNAAVDAHGTNALGSSEMTGDLGKQGSNFQAGFEKAHPMAMQAPVGVSPIGVSPGVAQPGLVMPNVASNGAQPGSTWPEMFNFKKPDWKPVGA